MRTHPFGSTELQVSEIGLGCARLGGIFQGGGAGFVDLLSAARDGGITFFDTANIYSQGESEALLGRAFERVRDRVVLASKAGYSLPAQRRFIARVKPFVRPLVRALGIRRDALPAAVRGSLGQDFSPALLQRELEGSLKRLRTDYLDLFQLHSPPADVVERGEWVEALERLKRAGKIRYYGVSCDTVDAGLAALGHGGVSSVQLLVNLLESGAAEAVVPRAHERGVAVIARECLANGLLVKPVADIDLAKYCSSKEEEARRREQLAAFHGRASDEGRPLVRLALDYVRRLPGVSVTLVGARNVGQLERLLREVSA